MEGLVKRGLLRVRTEAAKWLVPSREEVLALLDGYIVSFAPFHERGLMIPPHPFLWGLLHHYWIELQHLNPNGIQHVVAFIALCKGYLGIEPHFELWRYFFFVSLHKKRERSGDPLVPMGCASIHLQGQWSAEYMALQLSRSNKGWHAL
jgi:hypothetical protein